MEHDEEPAKIRLFVEAELDAGVSVGVTAQQAHYLKHVLRLGTGASVGLFNGRDGEWAARIDGIGRGWASLAVHTRTRPQRPDPDLWLVFAPIRRARIDFVAQKATELGAALLWPVFTQFTVMSRVNTERLRANAIEAAEQSERLSVPAVREPVSLDTLLAGWPTDRRLFVCDETGTAPPVATVFGASTLPRGTPAALLIGPEGGLAGAELDRLAKLPFVSRVGLGPRVLRADTAALAALACWQALAGDWSD
jgi:16S rRNA (uracil1498-N3)-methyltransferase